MSEEAPGSRRAALPRAVWIYFAAVAFTGIGFIAAFTVGTVAIFVITESRGLTGLPAAIGTIGTAAGAALLSTIMARRGRRLGLLVGLAAGVVGGMLAVAALALTASVLPALLLLFGAFVGFGFANAAAQLSRYAAADLVAAVDRGRAVGTVVWAGTIGAVVGPNLPNLVSPSEGTPGVGDLMIGFAAVGLVMLAAMIVLAVFLRSEPPASAPEPAESSGAVPLRVGEVLRLPGVRIGLIALVVSGVSMIALMSMTPVHLIEAGHGMSLIGLVLSAHTLGMFALSPVSGRLADRFGPVPVVIGGLAVVAGAGVLAAIAPASDGLVLITALFLLGFGWNLAFVSGSTLVARDTPAHIRIRVQGLTDAAFWSSAAAGSALAGVMLELTSYGWLALVATGLALLAIGLVAVQRRAPVPAGA